jgi:hypothetical protein
VSVFSVLIPEGTKPAFLILVDLIIFSGGEIGNWSNLTSDNVISPKESTPCPLLNPLGESLNISTLPLFPSNK